MAETTESGNVELNSLWRMVRLCQGLLLLCQKFHCSFFSRMRRTSFAPVTDACGSVHIMGKGVRQGYYVKKVGLKLRRWLDILL